MALPLLLWSVPPYFRCLKASKTAGNPTRLHADRKVAGFVRRRALAVRCRQCDQIRHRRSSDGRTVVEALRHFASAVTQPGCDVGGLHALSDSCHVKRVGKLDDGPDDGLGARICQDVPDQVLVEFDSWMSSLRR